MHRFKPKRTLLVGPAGCGKTHATIEAFETSLKTSPHLLRDALLFILPTAEHRERTIDLVLRHGHPGFFHRRITTFDRAVKAFLKLGGIDFATDLTRRMILKEIFSRLELCYFQDVCDTAGFLELMSRTIVELKEYLVEPRDLAGRLQGLKNPFPEFSVKYDDIAQIYQAYEAELERRNLIDQRDCLKVLQAGLDRGAFASPRLRSVWIDGFSDFSKLQISFIHFLTRHADEVTVTLTLDRDPFRRPLFQVVSETQSALEAIGFEKKWMPEENYRSVSKSLKHLERNLFGDPTVIDGPAGNDVMADTSIQVFEATGLAGEMEMAAREIKRLVRAHQYHFSDIALLVRSTDPYLQVIRSVFRKFEIPVEIHERFRMNTTAIARTLTSFFDILLNDWPRKDIFNFLKSSSRGADYELIAELELRALQKGIFKGRTCWFSSFPDTKAFQEIAHFEDLFLRLQTVDQFAVWVREVLSHFGLLDFADSADERTRMDRAAARRTLLLVEELKRKCRRDASGGAVFAKEFLALMEVDLFSLHSRDKNKVQVYNVSLARQKEYKVVFLAGLLEKQFPIQIKEDPILSDAERRALNEHGEVLKERLPRQAFERYLFFLAVTRAREHLILSYPRFDLEGKEALSSFYVEEVRALFEGELPGKKQLVTDVLPDWSDLATAEEAEQRVVKGIWSLPEGRRNRSEDRIALALYNHLISDPDFQMLVMRLLQPIEGVITDAHIRPYFIPPDGIWSPTMLEAYAECPYRFFSHRLLGLESQTEGIDLKRRGIMLHDVLQHFFTWQRDEWKGRVEFEVAKDFCMKKFNQLWEEEPLTGDRYYKIELERKRMQEMILQVLRLELVENKPPIAGLAPTHFEFQFQDLILKGETREIPLRGKIDRIDVDREGTFGLVIDYKTGKPFKLSSLENGTSLQLPLYLIAAREKLGLKPLGGHLYVLSKAKSSGFHHRDHLARAGLSTMKWNHFTEKEFANLIDRSIRFAEKFVGEIERAEIPVQPRDCVSYCPYSSLCRIEKWRLKYIYRDIAEKDKEAMHPKVKTNGRSRLIRSR